MRRAAWWVLLLCIFTIPWEYSLDFGAPLGNIARLLGIGALLAAVLTVLQEGKFRALKTVHWLVAAFFLWFCCTLLWSIDRAASFEKVRGYFQVCMIAWLIWELAETQDQVRAILRAWVAGSWVLAGLTVTELALLRSAQFRFAAYGQDPNDTARFLDLGFPAAALLLAMGEKHAARWLALLYFPIATIAVVATGSRGGAVAALVAWLGCGALFLRTRHGGIKQWVWMLPLVALAVWVVIPQATLARIATFASQVHGGDLNQRTTIWWWGWEAAKVRPLMGYGAGTFAAAAGLVPMDTAHNTALSILVEGGAVGLLLALAIFVECGRMAWRTDLELRLALGTMLAVWVLCSAVGSAAESRTTWLMVGLITVLADLRDDAGVLSQGLPLRADASSGTRTRPEYKRQEGRVGSAN